MLLLSYTPANCTHMCALKSSFHSDSQLLSPCLLFCVRAEQSISHQKRVSLIRARLHYETYEGWVCVCVCGLGGVEG